LTIGMNAICSRITLDLIVFVFLYARNRYLIFCCETLDTWSFWRIKRCWGYILLDLEGNTLSSLEQQGVIIKLGECMCSSLPWRQKNFWRVNISVDPGGIGFQAVSNKMWLLNNEIMYAAPDLFVWSPKKVYSTAYH
jgi:hypothetical protein